MKISAKILLLTLIPLVLALIFAVFLLQGQQRDQEALRSMGANVRLMAQMTALIPSLQKERGQSLILVSGGQNEATVRKLREETNALLEPFRQALQEAALPDAAKAWARQELDRLPAVRNLVDTRQSAAEVAKAYTNLVRNTLQLGHDIVNAPTTMGFGKIMANLSILLDGSESFALFRGMGSGIFTADQPIPAETAAQMVGLLASAESAFTSPALCLSVENSTELRQILSDTGWRNFLTLREQLLANFGRGQFGVNGPEFFGQATQVIDAVLQIVGRENQQMLERLERLSAQTSRETTLYWVLILVSFGTTGGISFWIIRSITRGLQVLSVKLAQMAEGQGDLTARLPEKGHDELAQIAAAFNRFIAHLEHTMSQLRHKSQSQFALLGHVDKNASVIFQVVERIAGQAEDISHSTEALSQRLASIAAASEEFSSSANNVASAMEEMSASMSQVRSSCQQEQSLSVEARHKVESTAVSMSQLAEATQEIGSFTDTIRSIASQTNLLALNASIEAATAGEAGRGFAVVASEIKNLAQKSAAAADDIVKKLTNAQTLCQQTEASVQDAANLICTIENLALDIAEAVNQQTAAAAEISSNAHAIHHGSENLAADAEASNREAQIIVESVKKSLQATRQTKTVAMISRDSANGLQSISEQVQAILDGFSVTKTQHDFAEIKKGHIGWLDRFVGSIAGAEPLDLNRVKDSTICGLGQWIGKADPNRDEKFKELRRAHDLFHRQMYDIAHEVGQGHMDRVVQSLQAVNATRKSLFEELDALAEGRR